MRCGLRPSPSGAGLTEFKRAPQKTQQRTHKTAALVTYPSRLLVRSREIHSIFPYEGMLSAVAEKRYAEGANVCREALEMKCNHAQLYLNLAELFHQEGRDRDAMATLRKGFISAGRDLRIRRALEKMGGRRPPILSMFGRGHSLNRILGRLRHQMIGLCRSR